MRRVLLLVVLALVLPATTWASSVIDMSNRLGTITGSDAGLSLAGSVLTQYGSIQGNLGSVTFTTGAFTSGNAQMGGTLAGGGTFTIMGNGANGAPTGVIFSGTFSPGGKWVETDNADGTHSYTLIISAVDSTGHVAVTSQMSFPTGKGLFFNGSIGAASGDTTLTLSTAVPEPGTLGLLGTGLLGIGGLMRRRVRIG